MEVQHEQTPRLPIKRHLISVRKASDSPLPVEGSGTHHFQHLHDRYLHEVDGEDCYELPLDLLALWVNRHRADFPRVTALLDLAANRGLHHNWKAIQTGETDPARMFFVAHDEEVNAPAQAFVKTAEGKTILPLPIHDAAVILGEHHAYAGYGKHLLIQSKGGDASKAAIEVLEQFLAEVGLQPNHAMIRKAYCPNCGSHSNAEI